jgi:hypothetical protein
VFWLLRPDSAPGDVTKPFAACYNAPGRLKSGQKEMIFKKKELIFGELAGKVDARQN